MGKDAYEYSRFVHMRLYKTLQDTLRKESRPKYKNQGEYLIAMYGWVEEFMEGVRYLETDIEGLAHYLQDVFASGLFRLELEEGKKDEEPENNTTLWYDRKCRGKRNRDYITLSNDAVTRWKAANYLKMHCWERLGSDPASTLKDMTLSVLDELKSRKLSTPSRIFDECCKNAKTDDDWLDLWAALLIYAHRGHVPENALPEMRPQPAYNLFMASKKEIQDKVSLSERCNGAKRIVLINYAGTSFLANQSITEEVDSDWSRFFYNLCLGATEMHIVLTNPSSPAAADAVQYKMRPLTLQDDIDLAGIIPRNLITLRDFFLHHPQANVNAYLTDVSLPCAYMKSEFQESFRDNLKIDLYLPSFGAYENGHLNDPKQSDDQQRQSFMVYRLYQPELYEVFSRNIEEILAHSIPAFQKED